MIDSRAIFTCYISYLAVRISLLFRFTSSYLGYYLFRISTRFDRLYRLDSHVDYSYIQSHVGSMMIYSDFLCTRILMHKVCTCAYIMYITSILKLETCEICMLPRFKLYFEDN